MWWSDHIRRPQLWSAAVLESQEPTRNWQLWPDHVHCAVLSRLWRPDIRVDTALSLPPGLPASVLSLCVRQADCSKDQTHARSLCSAAVTAVKAALKVTWALNLLTVPDGWGLMRTVHVTSGRLSLIKRKAQITLKLFPVIATDSFVLWVQLEQSGYYGEPKPQQNPVYCLFPCDNITSSLLCPCRNITTI